ncbi:hypothetical protein VTO42DRAFT_7004 [Malbranchea cinnamomea]
MSTVSNHLQDTMVSQKPVFWSDHMNGKDVNFTMDKDNDEAKLEQLLFGDVESFHNALMGHEVEYEEQPPSSEAELFEKESESDSDLAHIDDTELFFFDTGTVVTSKESPSTAAKTLSSQQGHGNLNPLVEAWEDSDDERLRISLAGNDRLRKLRLTEAEDVISGKEYIKRLRRQFERLHPTPEWAKGTSGRCSKRRKTNRSTLDGRYEEDDSDYSGEEEDKEEEPMSSRPLALLLQNATTIIRADNARNFKEKCNLRAGVLDIERLKDVGGSQPSSVDSLCFHPHYPLLLSSGPSSTLFLHHVSARSVPPNPLLTSLHVRRTPIYTSAFSLPTGNRIFFSGRRRYFHIWDLDSGKIQKINGPADRREEQKSMERFKLSPCGRWMGIVGTTKKGGGIITVLDATTLQWIAEVRIDSRGGVADFAWWSDGEGMCVVGKNGEVSEWVCREKRIIARWADEGAVGTTVINLGGKSNCQVLGGDRWVAIGSSSGIVNIYDRRPWANAIVSSRGGKTAASDDVQSAIPRHPRPTRMLDQLTTPISHIVFSDDGQLLVIASRWKRDALRLVHLPSCTVYKNWPTPNTPLGRISAVAIAATSRTLAVANEQGKIRLWEIHG